MSKYYCCRICNQVAELDEMEKHLYEKHRVMTEYLKFFFREFPKPKKIFVAHDYVEIGGVQLPIRRAKEIFEYLAGTEEVEKGQSDNYKYQDKYSKVVITHQLKRTLKVTF